MATDKEGITLCRLLATRVPNAPGEGGCRARGPTDRLGSTTENEEGEGDGGGRRGECSRIPLLAIDEVHFEMDDARMLEAGQNGGDGDVAQGCR